MNQGETSSMKGISILFSMIDIPLFTANVTNTVARIPTASPSPGSSICHDMHLLADFHCVQVEDGKNHTPRDEFPNESLLLGPR
jgi:hypothetical protein